jgi:hypothetical protein
MPTERLIIENFKGISHLELEVKPFTVMIGPQSVGKSVTAKLLYYFKTLPREMFIAAVKKNPDDSPEGRLMERFVKLLPPPNRMAGKSSVRYSIGEATFSLVNDGDDDSSWEIELPLFFEREYLRIKAQYLDLAKQEQEMGSFADLSSLRTSLQVGFVKKLEESLGEKSAIPVWFIPAGRSFYAQIERDFVSFFESANLDPFVGLYGQFLPFLKEPQFHSARRWKSAELVGTLTERLLSGKYEREGQKDFINVEDGRKLPTALWSSGQQESLPLVLHMQRWIEGSLQPDQHIAVFIEEPEAHLFPESQRLMMELIALAFNSAPKGTNIFITTHSPYVLSTLNVLLKAGQLFQQNPDSANRIRIARTVPELEALAPGSVGAYYMDRKECRSIMDAETGLIDGSAIDDVSGELAEQFDALNALK